MTCLTRMTRTLMALMFGSSLLLAQIPNPLNLPDPLGLSKKPAPAPTAPRAPREGREGRRVERKPKRERHDQGKHKGQDKRDDRRDDRKGHDRH
ncbi:hypothetical protein [Geothrix sp.]|jgi:hypothetical protein|uniref:hypothetical protein n=1 Tax=Geothrix sp. TaxID=1962974 RepID=UPI0025C40545|nr:hypothetical protein [Geothrix sp.]